MAGVQRGGGIYGTPTPEADAAAGNQIREGGIRGDTAKAFLTHLGYPFPNGNFDFSSGGFGNGQGFSAPTIGPVKYDQAGVEGAENAAFARAKDRAAMTAQGALRGLQGALQSRGMGGAGYEAGQIGKQAVNAADTTGEVSRDLAMDSANKAQHAADMSYEGGIAQRGQDLTAQAAAAEAQARRTQLAISARGQSMQGLDAALRAATSAY